jgi:hypothetical protein
MSTIATKDGMEIYYQGPPGPRAVGPAPGMSERVARRGLLIGAVTVALAAAGAGLAGAAAKPTVTVHKSPT